MSPRSHADSSTTPTIVCTPGIARIYRPLSLQVRGQRAPRTASQEVPPEVEQQPL